ncbi:phospholipase D-like domain-containing protein [Tenuibacillus multivorans]|uniref:Cardiolipin synthase n=1 Tax=Tenuibacillus multivorans TaxID=237069 RepID=A0A1G9WYM7_9BACI|nr:phospholipase D-like domain-containing protein [Tenuibacillus multivorans]GEL77300.1 cardiolipin synthase [Tenuibacillus multivorans]SDM89549.1 cardiolipin synthase [Tenuibacillus multivorans]
MWVLIVVIILVIVTIIILQPTEKVSVKTYPKRTGDIKFFWNGKPLYKQFFDDIQEAKDYVCISFYIVKRDAFSDRFMDLLTYASERGVSVYLMIDLLGSYTISRKKVERLRRSGAKVCYSNPLRLRSLCQSINNRNHRKFSIIDGKTAYIGGYNIGDEYINDTSNFPLWRDYHIRITGDVIQDILDVFTGDWERNTQENLDLPVNTVKSGDVTCQITPSAGGTLQATFKQLIHSAKHSIEIGSPYFIPSEEIIQLLEQKAREKVDITILYPHQSDHLFVKEASTSYLIRMEKAGANVRLFTNGFYHAKVIFIDRSVCDIGTANFDRRSLFSNEEINFFIYDKTKTEEIYRYFEKDLQDSMPLYEDWIKHPNPLTYGIRKNLAKLLRPLL